MRAGLHIRRHEIGGGGGVARNCPVAMRLIQAEMGSALGGMQGAIRSRAT